MITNLLKAEGSSRDAWLASASRALKTEGDGLAQLAAALEGELGAALCDALDIMRKSRGRLIFSGIGKSGHICRKIAATFASTGTPAMFVHPSEASHGDLGMITRDDVIVMISNSGESAELKDVLDYAKRFGVTLIAMTARPDSTLAKEADVVLLLPRAQEACPIGLAPTTSTLLQMALGDALAVTLLEEKGFSARDFKMFHPGGKLGAALKHVGDVMHLASELPLVAPDSLMADALVTMTTRSFGCLGVIDGDGALVGIVTDGDLRRHMSKNLLDLPVAEVMTAAPRTIDPDSLASEALEILNTKQITSLFVVNDEGKPVGLVHIHDLLRLGVS